MRAMTILKSKLYLLIPFVLLFYGCSSDSEELNNAFRIGNNVYSFLDGLVIDNGEGDLVDDGIDEFTHQRYIFWMTDGKINLEGNNLADSSASYAMIIFIYAPSGSAPGDFPEGIYKFVSNDDLFSGSQALKGEYFFGVSYICFDENGDGKVEYDEGLKNITGGVKRIFGSPEKFNINFTYDFSLGEKAEGKYSGPIELLAN